MNIEVPGPASYEDHPLAETPHDSQPSLAAPWPRFWAKSFDVNLLAMPAGFLIALVFPTFFIAEADGSPPNPILLGMAITPLVMIMDAVLTSYFGTTVGKALAGLEVRDLEGNKVNIETSFKRSALVCVKGLALGIPGIAIFTQWSGYNAVKLAGITSWDETTKTRVYNKSNSLSRTVLVAIFAVAMLIFISFLNVIADS